MKRGARALFFDMQRLALVVWLLALPALALGAGASEVFEKVKDAVVVVKAIDLDGQEVGQGSGVVLPSGQVATNNHVTEQGVRFQVVAKGQAVSAVVVAKKANRDLALLLAPGLDARPAQLGRAGGLKVGQKVFAVGAPYGLELSLSEGIVSQLRGGKPPIIQTTAAISPGSSGGGLFNEQGQLVGITTFYFKEAQGLNFAIPVEWLGELIAHSKKAEAPFEAKSPKQARAPTPAVPPTDESFKDWAGRATALSAAEDWAGLLEHSKRWTKAQPKEPFAWMYVAFAYDRLGRYQEAVNAYKEVVRLKPDLAGVWYNLGAPMATLAGIRRP
jgi:S1-C subfamily serine protease